MKPVVITWGFSQDDGTPYLDCYLEIRDCSKDGTAVRIMELRGSTQGTTLCLLQVPADTKREDIESYIKMNTPDVIELLRKAKVRSGDITRKGIENQALDFIKFA